MSSSTMTRRVAGSALAGGLLLSGLIGSGVQASTAEAATTSTAAHHVHHHRHHHKAHKHLTAAQRAARAKAAAEAKQDAQEAKAAAARHHGATKKVVKKKTVAKKTVVTKAVTRSAVRPNLLSAPESCEASWYGDPQMTASGEWFNPNALTAANKTLPMGTKVLVKNTANGKSVVVRVNDRGPYVSGRCFDLSTKAFSTIADLDAGVVHISYQVIG